MLLAQLAQATTDFNSYDFNSSYSAASNADAATAAGVGIVLMLIYLFFVTIFSAIMIVSMWKIFTKAGKEGWAAIIPIYNVIVELEIIRKPIWWIVLMLIPFVNLVVFIIISLELAKVFGKSAGFGILLALVPIIGYPMLAFGDAKYQGAPGGGTAPQAPAQTPPTPPQAPTPPAQPTVM